MVFSWEAGVLSVLSPCIVLMVEQSLAYSDIFGISRVHHLAVVASAWM